MQHFFSGNNSCYVWGDPHINPFDWDEGVEYLFQGKCRYVLTQKINPSSPSSYYTFNPPFAVNSQFEPCGLPGRTCLKMTEFKNDAGERITFDAQTVSNFEVISYVALSIIFN